MWLKWYITWPQNWTILGWIILSRSWFLPIYYSAILGELALSSVQGQTKELAYIQQEEKYRFYLTIPLNVRKPFVKQNNNTLFYISLPKIVPHAYC